MNETKQYRVSLDEMRQFQKAIACDRNCTLAGDLQGGHLSVQSPLGPIALHYSHDGRNLLTVTIERVPPFVSANTVFNEVGLKIQQAAARV